MIQEIIRHIKRKKGMYIVIMIAIVLDYVVTIIPTRIIQTLIDAISTNTLTKEMLVQQLTLFAIIIVAGYVISYIWVKYLFSESYKFKFTFRSRLFRKLVSMRIPFYDKFRSGDMMTRFTNDIDGFSEMMGYGIMSMVMGIVAILVVIPAMFYISWQITLISIIPIIILGIIVFYVGRLQDEAVEESREAVANLSNEVLEVVEGIRVTRAYGKKELGTARFRSKTRHLSKKANRIMYYQVAYGRIVNALLALSTAIILGMGSYYMQQGWITLGQVVALQLFSLYLMGPMWMLSDFILVYQTGKVSYKKITELLETSDELEEDGTHILEVPEIIEFKDYSFKYMNSEYSNLEGINLRIEKGKTLGIVGKTGSGKTTLIRQLLRQYPIGQGEFLINGKNVTEYQRQSIEQQIGYVPQEHVLFSRTVQENIEVGKSNASQKELDFAVATASFTQDLERMVHGYQTLVGEKGVSISGGQKQRISIARAFIKDPNILILDDSLSAVDARTERIIIENIQALRQGKTNVIVTHRLSAVNHADWIIVLDEGRIIEEGTPEQLFHLGGWYREQYERQQMEGETA